MKAAEVLLTDACCAYYECFREDTDPSWDDLMDPEKFREPPKLVVQSMMGMVHVLHAIMDRIHSEGYVMTKVLPQLPLSPTASPEYREGWSAAMDVMLANALRPDTQWMEDE